MIIDLHADTALLLHWLGYDFCLRHRPLLSMGAVAGHLDLPRLEEAGVDAQVFGLVGLPIEADPFGTIHAMIDRLEYAARQSQGRFALVRNGHELRAVRAAGARAGLLALEGVHPLKGSLDRLEALLARGLASVGLAHFHANEACRPAFGFGRRDDEGLSPFGRELVERVGHRGALLDLTHVNRKGFFDALYHATGPVYVSHTGVKGAHAHWRNLDDEQLRALADRSGVAGVIFARNFLGGNGLDAVVRHVKHIIEVAGDEMPALGSDFDGIIVPVRGLSDVRGLPALRSALAAAGLSERQVDGVMGQNALALLDRLAA